MPRPSAKFAAMRGGFSMLAARFAIPAALACTTWAAAAPAPVALPTCASIPVELMDKIDSAKAAAGDRFRFRAIETVVLPDRTRIERGTTGYGVVEYASPAGAHAKPGQLVLEARYFTAPHATDLQVTVDAAASSELHSGSTGNAPGIVGAVPIPFVGIAVGAFNFFHAGKNVTIPVGYRFAVTPVGDLSKLHRCTPEFQL
jgi:hypothetical protein